MLGWYVRVRDDINIYDSFENMINIVYLREISFYTHQLRGT